MADFPEAPYRYGTPQNVHGVPLSGASRHRGKTPPTSSETIQNVTQSAFLAKVTVPFNNLGEGEGYYNKVNKFIDKGYTANENINTQGENTARSSRFDLWVTEVNYGFSVSGPTAVSQYYRRHYTQAINLTPISVQGICYDENEYDDLASFIREGQVAATTEPKNTFRLFIPGAKVDCIGVVDVFRGGFITNNTGVPVAPKFTFNFIIFKDLKDNTQNFGAQSVTNVIEEYRGVPGPVGPYQTYKNDYIVTQLMDTVLDSAPKPEVRKKPGPKKTKPKATPPAAEAIKNLFGGGSRWGNYDFTNHL